MTDEDLRKAWERGKPMQVDRVKRASTSVLSIRVPDSIFEALTERARSEGKAAGTLARELLESAVAAQSQITPPTLANMFTRWVGEALYPAATPRLEITYASPVISSGFWVSYERLYPDPNYVFARYLSHFSGFKDPVWTSRNMEPDTEPAGEKAA